MCNIARIGQTHTLIYIYIYYLTRTKLDTGTKSQEIILFFNLIEHFF